FQQLEMRGEPLPQLLARGAEGRTILVRDEIIHRQVLASGFQPAQHGADVFITFVQADGTEQRVFEKPIESLRRFVMQEIREPKVDVEFSRDRWRSKGLSGGFGSLFRKLDCAWRDIESVSAKAGPGPFARIMPRAAAGHGNRSAPQFGMCRKKIHQP